MQEGIEQRLIRIETKIVRGFEEMGVDTTSDRGWLELRGDTIYIDTLARSLQVILRTARKQGAKLGEQKYRVIYRDTEVAVI